MGSQEVSKPVVIAVIAVAVILIGLLGWYLMKPQSSSGGPAAFGPPGMGGAAVPGARPGPGGSMPPSGSPR